MAGSIYFEKDAEPLQRRLQDLQDVLAPVIVLLDSVTATEITRALTALRDACKATTPIYKGSHVVGFGIDKIRKAVACDTAMSLIKEIKAVKAW